MAIVILVFGGLVNYVAMPALAGLLIVIGLGTVKPAQVISVAKTGTVQLTVMSTTLVLTMIVPLQYAVLVGVGIAIILHVVRQSTTLRTRQLLITDDGDVQEVEPPKTVPANEVVVLQAYGSIFFASAPALESQLPTVAPSSHNSVVILRARGADEIGATLSAVLERYMTALHAVDSKLILVTDNPRIRRQLEATGTMSMLGKDNFYSGTEWLGRTVRLAHKDAQEWVRANQDGSASHRTDDGSTHDESE